MNTTRALWLRTSALALLAGAAALIPSVARADFDADHDTVVDSADAFPCDAQATSVIFAPAQGEHGMMLFEDQWPEQSDLDFNDVALTYNYIFTVNSAGQVTKMRATFNALAVGGVYNNGFGFQLPVLASTVSSITKSIGNGAAVALSPSGTDSQLTIKLSDNVRELFGNQAQQINSDPVREPMQGQTMTVEIVFSAPVALDTGAAPFDLYIFRTEQQGHEIHRPEFSGTRSMDQSLFGRGIDGSSSGRNFVDRSGLPFALNLPSINNWPKEGKAISTIFPGIVQFAASGGRSNTDFYRTGTASANMYAPVSGMVGPEARFVGADHVPAETGCVTAWGYAVDFGHSRNQYAYSTVMDAQGNTYVAGYVRGALTGFSSAGGLDIYVAKYDGRTGAELWTQQFGGPGDDVARDLVLEPSTGNIYLTGETRGTFYGETPVGAADMFVMKLNASGVRQWSHLLGGSGEDTGYGVALGRSGEVYIGGGSTSNNLAGASYPGGVPNSVLARYESNGTRSWVRQFRTDTADGSNYNYTLDIAVDPVSGGVYSVGAERRYNRDASAAENQFLVKYDSSGNSLWTQHIGDHGYRHSGADQLYGYAIGVTTDNDGSAYVAGSWYAGSSNGQWGDWSRRTGDTSADATVTKVAPGGAMLWTHAAGSDNNQDDIAESVAVSNAAGQVFLTGHTGGAFTGQTNLGGNDYFLGSYGFDGARNWIVQGGTASNDVGYVAAVQVLDQGISSGALDGSVYIVGNSTGALGSPDSGNYAVSISTRAYRTGASTGTPVVASKLGWVTGAWSSCPVLCGGGTQTRSVECHRADGALLPDSSCIEAKPPTSQACGTDPCTYRWVSLLGWSECPLCGGGTSTRDMRCIRTNDGTIVADNLCTDPKPATTMSCNTGSCYTYHWFVGPWSSCSVACGTGTVTRPVVCYRSDGAVANDSDCINAGLGPRVNSSQECSNGPCNGGPSNPNASCKNLRAMGNTSSGVYSIDPDGSGTAWGSMNVYCDMSTNGGGWTLTYKVRNGTEVAYWWDTHLPGSGSTFPTSTANIGTYTEGPALSVRASLTNALVPTEWRATLTRDGAYVYDIKSSYQTGPGQGLYCLATGRCSNVQQLCGGSAYVMTNTIGARTPAGTTGVLFDIGWTGCSWCTDWSIVVPNCGYSTDIMGSYVGDASMASSMNSAGQVTLFWIR